MIDAAASTIRDDGLSSGIGNPRVVVRISVMRIDIVTLFPEIALAPLSDSIVQRARAAGIVEVVGHQLRDWS
jgi:hypothetical protein